MSEVSSKTRVFRCRKYQVRRPPLAILTNLQCVTYMYFIHMLLNLHIVPTYTTNYSYKSVIILNVFKPKRVLYFVIVADLTCCPGYSEANDVYLVSVLPNKKEIMILCGIQHSEYKRLIKYTFCIY